ncbi:MAG: TonB-dependent receptor [Acidobacteriota bacterium]
MRIRFSAIFLAIVLAAPMVLAQQGTSEIKGQVTGGDGSLLPGVSVTIKHQESGIVRLTVSDKDGVYFMSGVTPGTYALSAELSGFKTFRRRNVRLEVGKTSTVDVKLDMGAASEEITVTASAPIIDVTSKEVGGNITAKELTELPSVNRNFIGFVGLLPGVVPSISTESFGSDSVSVNGQDSRNNNYMVDGGNNNDDVIGQRAGTQARTPIEAIQEFQVLTGQYDAEFGRTTGGVINAVTKQGTNDFKGVLFGFLQDAAYTNKDFFRKQSNQPKPDTRFVQYGGTLGGPIIQDRLHFFTSIERVPNDRGNAFTITSRPDVIFPVTQDRVWNMLARFDHQITANHSWAVRWLRESSPQQNQIIPLGNGNNVTPAAAREESDVDMTAVAHLNSVLGASKLNTVRVSWTMENVSFGNPNFNGNGHDQAALAPTLNFLTYQDQQSDVAQARINNSVEVNEIFNWYANKHDMKFGLSYENVREKSTDQGNMNGTFTFATDKPFNAADPSSYPERFSIRVPGATQLDLKGNFITAFAQDKWSLNDRTTLSAGLRYDVETLKLPENDNPLFSDPNDYPVDRNNLAPRIGLTYELPGAKTTVFRGGVGRFYDKTHLELIQAVVTAGMFSRSFVVTFPTLARDPGPRLGNKPTDPFLVNGPTVNRALLQSMFAAGARIKNTGTINLDNPDRVVPYSDQLSIGAQREILPGMSLNLDYVHAEGHDQLMLLDLNPGTRATTNPSNAVVRTNTAVYGNSAALERVNTGSNTFDAIEFQLDHHLGASYQYRVSYTYSRARGNSSGNGAPQSNFQLLGDMNLDENEGPSDFDKPHNLVLSGSWAVPHTGGLTLAMVGRYLSGDPLTIQDQNFDVNRNGILFDPLPAGKYSGTGLNSISVSNDGGRNGARGPDFMQIDARVGYRIPVHTARVELIGEVFNLADRANFANPTGNRASTNFLRLTALRAGGVPRTMQFGVRMSY